MDDFNTLSIETIQEFVSEYGEKKYRQVYDALVSSSSFKKNLPILMAGDRPPNPSELVVVVQNIRFFVFSSKRNTAIAATILLIKWNELCNSNNEICDDSKLIKILENVFEKASGLLW